MALFASASSGQTPGLPAENAKKAEPDAHLKSTSDVWANRINQVTLDEERRLGDRLLKIYLKKLEIEPARLSQRGQGYLYLEDVAGELSGLMKNQQRYGGLEFVYITSQQPILFGLPGGKIFASGKRVFRSKSQDEFFALLAHECGLIDRGFFLEPLFDDKGKRHSLEDVTDEELTAWVEGTFAPELELLAHTDVLRWMKETHYQPKLYAVQLASEFRIANIAQAQNVDLPQWRIHHQAIKQRLDATKETYE